MTDTYQAIYDGVRSKMSNGDIGNAIENAIRDMGLSHYADMASNAAQNAAAAQEAPSVLYRPTLTLDGNMYCALYGEDLMNGCAGFGETAQKAMWDFDRNWAKQKAPTPKIKHAHSGESE